MVKKKYCLKEIFLNVTVSEYKKRIWTYEKRRTESYKTSRRLSSKIRQMKACLASREARERKSNEKVDSLLEAINNFFCVDIKNGRSDFDHKLARNVYFKIGLEMQIREVLLCKKINRSTKTASYHREVFTKSFKTNPINRKSFYNFKYYLKSLAS